MKYIPLYSTRHNIYHSGHRYVIRRIDIYGLASQVPNTPATYYPDPQVPLRPTAPCPNPQIAHLLISQFPNSRIHHPSISHPPKCPSPNPSPPTLPLLTPLPTYKARNSPPRNCRHLSNDFFVLPGRGPYPGENIGNRIPMNRPFAQQRPPPYPPFQCWG